MRSSGCSQPSATASEGRSHPSTELLPWRFPMLYLSLLLILFIPQRKLLFAEGHCLAHAHLCESHSDPQTLCLQQRAHGLENTAGLNQRLVFSWSPAAPQLRLSNLPSLSGAAPCQETGCDAVRKRCAQQEEAAWKPWGQWQVSELQSHSHGLARILRTGRAVGQQAGV